MVHACIQYASSIPRRMSSSVISTKYIGRAAPAHVKTASGAFPSWGAHAAPRAAADSAAVYKEKEYARSFWPGYLRTAYVYSFDDKLV
jgi:hypothetical protein